MRNALIAWGGWLVVWSLAMLSAQRVLSNWFSFNLSWWIAVLFIAALHFVGTHFAEADDGS